MHFADALTAAATNKSPVCVGLDPNLTKLPEGISADAQGVKEFCTNIIDAVADIAGCIKPQSAYFEALGPEGVQVLWDIAAYAKEKDVLVILDAKRNDIGSTCDAYAQAYLHSGSPFDALTVTPYLGSDGILPFIEQATKNDKGIYVLVKTSNPSSGELQDLPIGDEVVHEHMAQLCEGWAQEGLGSESGYSCVGAVVGATYPEEMKYLRSLMSHVPFLIPGYGAQGGTAADVAHGFGANGTGAVVNASRSIIYASSAADYADAAHQATLVMAEDLKQVLTQE